MKRSAVVLTGLLAGSFAVAGGLSALASGSTDDDARGHLHVGAAPLPLDATDDAERLRRRAAFEAMLDRDYPRHGRVTAPQISVRKEPDPDAQVIGWLRLGGHVRLAPDPVQTPTCATGWHRIYPRGWACAGEGIEVSAASSLATGGEGAADTDSPLPYRYLVVREPQVPEYHRLPTRDEQRAAAAHAARYVELLNGDQERRAQLLREGRLPHEPPSPAVVARYLERNFYVASNGVEVRSSRRFARTVRGSYVKEAQLIERTGADFHGVELDGETTLPIAWAVRTSRPLRREVRSDGTERFVEDDEMEPWERQERLPWLRRQRFGDRIYHVLEGPDGEPRYLRAWFVGVAEQRDPPEDVGADEPWVHVDVSEQTAVVYRGETPVYATLVSSGLEGHDTPLGEFTIRRKFVSDTMANLGPDAGDESYRIDDVPWTQYFEGSVALHGAFWHQRFGLPRSHGCVNLAPRDARWIFEHTEPRVPEGWHGVSTEPGTGFDGSRVLVTE